MTNCVSWSPRFEHQRYFPMTLLHSFDDSHPGLKLKKKRFNLSTNGLTTNIIQVLCLVILEFMWKMASPDKGSSFWVLNIMQIYSSFTFNWILLIFKKNHRLSTDTYIFKTSIFSEFSFFRVFLHNLPYSFLEKMNANTLSRQYWFRISLLCFFFNKITLRP